MKKVVKGKRESRRGMEEKDETFIGKWVDPVCEGALGKEQF
jgi:hypothetical protein